jgi:hypothetical protein
VCGRVTVFLDDDILATEGLFESGADLLDRHRLLELRDDRRAAGELDPPRDPLGEDHRGARQDDDPRQNDGVPPPSQEVEFGVLENVHG